MEDWQKEIVNEVQKKWGFLESDDIKVQQLITQVCIFTMVEMERKLKQEMNLESAMQSEFDNQIKYR